MVILGGEVRVPHILATFVTVKKKYKLHVQIGVGVSVPDISKSLFTVKKKYKLHV